MPTIVALGLLAQPGEESLAVGSESISSSVRVFPAWLRSFSYLSRYKTPFSQHTVSLSLTAELGAFVEASGWHADTRGGGRGNAGGGIRTSVAILENVVGVVCWGVRWAGLDGGGRGVAGAGGQVSDQQDWGIVMVEYVVHSGRGAGGTSRGSPGWVKWGSSAWLAGTGINPRTAELFCQLLCALLRVP